MGAHQVLLDLGQRSLQDGRPHSFDSLQPGASRLLHSILCAERSDKEEASRGERPSSISIRTLTEVQTPCRTSREVPVRSRFGGASCRMGRSSWPSSTLRPRWAFLSSLPPFPFNLTNFTLSIGQQDVTLDVDFKNIFRDDVIKINPSLSSQGADVPFFFLGGGGVLKEQIRPILDLPSRRPLVSQVLPSSRVARRGARFRSQRCGRDGRGILEGGGSEEEGRSVLEV